MVLNVSKGEGVLCPMIRNASKGFHLRHFVYRRGNLQERTRERERCDLILVEGQISEAAVYFGHLQGHMLAGHMVRGVMLFQ